MSTYLWDRMQYERYAGERSRPFFDLIARVGTADAAFVVDLGCGSGALTAALADRWPAAVVEGVDSSAEMLAGAEAHARPGRVRFALGDLKEWRPRRAVDVLLSNAALQWVPDHADLFPRFVESLTPGGWFAFQVPGNFASPSHTILRDLCASPAWRVTFAASAPREPAAVLEPAEYVARLTALDCNVDAWETTYYHLLPGEDPVLEWMKGTALRPVLAVLKEPERQAFLDQYGAELRAAYPAQARGTVLPFRRIFAVAQKAG